jgi:hypothetical protein
LAVEFLGLELPPSTRQVHLFIWPAMAMQARAIATEHPESGGESVLSQSDSILSECDNDVMLK